MESMLTSIDSNAPSTPKKQITQLTRDQRIAVKSYVVLDGVLRRLQVISKQQAQMGNKPNIRDISQILVYHRRIECRENHPSPSFFGGSWLARHLDLPRTQISAPASPPIGPPVNAAFTLSEIQVVSLLRPGQQDFGRVGSVVAWGLRVSTGKAATTENDHQ